MTRANLSAYQELGWPADLDFSSPGIWLVMYMHSMFRRRVVCSYLTKRGSPCATEVYEFQEKLATFFADRQAPLAKAASSYVTSATTGDS